ncbi:T. brucei spp.-specific protein [Trypanosoma brucei gambiense DAL972]|uniref:T. brucei spp.-specific protein n=1 Tax=Trypanosoma brucei gambiense (strain MHOM/CI/86/DAL972) TaxID=679716 RepID=D0A832_TRYB9|nr:T. brucei spp.-specific protein [Trypanosoma brucei gambiense DAL972]CBH17833.1 T. brucei spp.-specific protein [Trypanosoma brucei gambiense DAL972]|eukprot:XP_011780097.1 T. brucei spp.-specific protein [Trypanosoma brucei gambiense DAL972]
MCPGPVLIATWLDLLFLFSFVFFPHFLIIFFFHPFLCQIVDVLMTSFCRCVVLPFFFCFFFSMYHPFLCLALFPLPPPSAPYFTSSLLALPFRVLPSGKRSYELSVISKNCEQKKKRILRPFHQVKRKEKCNMYLYLYIRRGAKANVGVFFFHFVSAFFLCVCFG